MNFDPHTRAWILLVTLVIGSGGSVGIASFLGGAHWIVATFTGLVTASTNVYHALNKSPKDKASDANQP